MPGKRLKAGSGAQEGAANACRGTAAIKGGGKWADVRGLRQKGWAAGGHRLSR